MQLEKFNKWSQPVHVGLVIVMLLLILIVSVCRLHTQKFYDSDNIDMTVWFTSNNSSISITEIPAGKATLTRDVSRIDFEQRQFCLQSVNTHFEVFADGRRIYQYQPKYPSFYGKGYGMYIHEIVVPNGTKALKLIAEPVFSGETPTFLNVCAGDGGYYVAQIFRDHIFDFCICLLMAVCGLFLITANIIRNIQLGVNNMDFLTLGSFTVLIALITMNDTFIPQILTQNPALIQLVNYVSLMLIPYPGVAFVAAVTKQMRSPLLPLMMGAVLLNTIVSWTLTCFGVTDFFYLLHITQAICAVAVLLAGGYIASAFRNKLISHEYFIILVISAFSLVLGSLIDLIRAVISIQHLFSLGASFFTRFGAIVFLLLVGYSLLQQFSKMRIDKDRAEVKAQLAYIDGLTNMKNRLAFNEKEQALTECPMCMIIQLDINNLKTVNDVHGHLEGDRHIIGAAHIIEDSFGKQGECFRTGGDEFICVIEGPDCKFRAEAAAVDLKRLVTEYNERENPPVALQIANGSAMYRALHGNLEETERLADERMYENKRRLKATA